MEGIKISRVSVFLVLVVGIFGLQSGVFCGVDAGRVNTGREKGVQFEDGTQLPGIAEEDKTVQVQYFGQQSVVSKNFFPYQMDLPHLTHVIYAYLQVTSECKIGSTNRYADFEAVYPEIGMDWSTTSHNKRGNIGAFNKLKETYSHFKLLVSIGGSANNTKEASKYIGNCLSHINTRTVLVDSAVDLVDDYELDGIDFYWQYPGVDLSPPTVEPTSSSSTSSSSSSSSTTSTTTPTPLRKQNAIENINDDGQNLVSFLGELRTALDVKFPDNHKLVTVAQSGKYEQVVGNPVHVFCEIADFMNLMPYKFEGSDWDKVTAINDPLYNDTTYVPNPSPNKNINWFVSTLIQKGCPANKLVMGIPLYGQGWRGTKGLYLPAEGKCHGVQEEGLVSFWHLYQNYLPNTMYVRHWSHNTRTPYIYNGDVLISYDDEESVNQKVLYARDNEMKGYLLFEASDDHQFILTSAAFDTWNDYDPNSTTTSTTTTTTIPSIADELPTTPNCPTSKPSNDGVNNDYCVAVCNQHLRACGSVTDKLQCVKNLIPKINRVDPCIITAKVPAKRI